MSNPRDPEIEFVLPDRETAIALLSSLQKEGSYNALGQSLLDAVRGQSRNGACLALAELLLNIAFDGVPEEEDEPTPQVVNDGNDLFAQLVLLRGYGHRMLIELCAAMLMATVATSEYVEVMRRSSKTVN